MPGGLPWLGTCGATGPSAPSAAPMSVVSCDIRGADLSGNFFGAAGFLAAAVAICNSRPLGVPLGDVPLFYYVLL